MSRYSQPQTQPAQPTLEGDNGYTGLNMKLDRDKLTAGQMARAENNRFNRGIAAPRGGTIMPTFANVYPVGVIWGSGLFSNPNGEEHIIVAGTNEVLTVKAGSFPGSILPPTGETFDTPIEFAQHFQNLLLHRPDGRETLQWDGAAAAFVPIRKSNPDDTSTVLMPNPPWSVNFADRAIFPTGPDTIGVSDIDDYTSYDPILMDFRINTGTADHIVGAYPFAKNNLIIGKTRGIDVITGFVGDLSNAALETLSTEIGMGARKATRMVGGDMFLLSIDHFGIYRITEIIQDRLQAEPVPISDSIESLMKRVNWKEAVNAVANVHDIYYVIALPIDGSKVNNALLVYNTVTQQWESFDSWNPAANMGIDNLIVTDYYGRAATYAVANRGGQSGIFALGIGNDDQMFINPDHTRIRYPIDHTVETRGYATLGWNATMGRDFKRVEIPVATLRPSVTVTELTDKARDERILSTTTRNPAKYWNFDKPDYVADNTNRDFEAPGREDYSLDLSATDFDLTDAGVELEIKQREPPLRFSTKARGRFISYRVENHQGECEVGSLMVESAGTQREKRKAA
jgi:hypothetical protein